MVYFSKNADAAYHCTKFYVSDTPLSRDTGFGRKCPPPGLRSPEKGQLIGLNSRLSTIQCLQLDQPSIYGLFYPETYKNDLVVVAHALFRKKLSVLWPAFYLLKGNSVLLFQPKEN